MMELGKLTVELAYDENDDGFQFTRRASRRATRAQPSPEPIPEEPAEAPPARRRKVPVAAPEPEQNAATNRRRSARLSGDHNAIMQVDGPAEREQPMKPLPKRSKKIAPLGKLVEKPLENVAEKSAKKPVEKPAKKSVKEPAEKPAEKTPAEKEKEKGKARQHTPAPEPQDAAKSAFAGTKTPIRDEKKRDGATKIMLPFADTPVITRNKEMRKGNKDGHRRSSTGLRGRRASSLIDSGLSNALPHSEVEVRDFYKYIEQSLPEPRRMKQLLTWCGSRALPEKPSGEVKNANAIMAARAIQQELIHDFANKPELSDWFSRPEVEPPTVVKRPNPQNEKNQITLHELEEEIKRYASPLLSKTNDVY
jgi:kinetochore protein Mis13/DSN1